MSKSTSAALGGMVFATMVGALAVAAGGWFGLSYHYGMLRHQVAEKVLATAEWVPTRVERADAEGDCSAANLREEAERLLADVDVFEVSKVESFGSAPTAQRARELSRTMKAMTPAMKAFLEAYTCKEPGRLARSGREQKTAGPTLAKAVGVTSWTDASKVEDLRKVVFVGRDAQATSGLYEFIEGARIMGAAYDTLGIRLSEGALDRQLDDWMTELQVLGANEDSAALHWRVGARVLIGDLLGPDWDANPPTPLQAKAILDSMDVVLESLEAMPDLANQPYPERHEVLSEWVAKHDMSSWDAKFEGFGEAGLQADAEATRAHAHGRGLLIGAALRKFRRSRGYCPRELDDLVKSKVLPAVPEDPLAGAPFTYDRRACTVTSAKPLAGNLAEVVVKATP